MSIKGKWEMSFRVLGMILFLFGIIFNLVLDFYVLRDTLIYLLSVVIIGFQFALILGFKFELEFLTENRLTILIVTIVALINILIIGSILSSMPSTILIFLFLTLSNSLGIISWNFSLSFYKKKKIIFIVGSLAYTSTSIFFRFLILMKTLGFIGLFPIIFISAGIGTILTAEILLIKKALLKYI